jgi:hypothetical protein
MTLTKGGDNMAFGQQNYDHVLAGPCSDPDCELHHPAMIEDWDQRLTACAWFLAGAQAAVVRALEDFDANVFGDSDDRWAFLGDYDPSRDSLGMIHPQRSVETDLLEDR